MFVDVADGVAGSGSAAEDSAGPDCASCMSDIMISSLCYLYESLEP